jgi:hypothetical protein
LVYCKKATFKYIDLPQDIKGDIDLLRHGVFFIYYRGPDFIAFANNYRIQIKIAERVIN